MRAFLQDFLLFLIQLTNNNTRSRFIFLWSFAYFFSAFFNVQTRLMVFPPSLTVEPPFACSISDWSLWKISRHWTMEAGKHFLHDWDLWTDYTGIKEKGNFILESKGWKHIQVLRMCSVHIIFICGPHNFLLEAQISLPPIKRTCCLFDFGVFNTLFWDSMVL